MSLKPLEINPLPHPLSLKKLIGPSFIILALGLGSGEVILWPYLTANFGLGIIWGALLGLTFVSESRPERNPKSCTQSDS